ncbi:MAG: GntR family transcriptional regulator [Paracoccus denitrificans]|uniref:GntR family transcriptional regulator n=1 Tax=Paracoccus denitrificans TaxID=266 RepID=A0A533IG86_PARDE|nr:MAG: GntR family transcriptional regulator [Paracoccus denitrificans]
MDNSGLSRIDLQPTTLRDVVLDRIRDAIIDGVFKPGDRLVERVLCEQLGVSRTVVRETLRYLDAEGLVEHVPHKGPVVASMSWDEARQIYDIRRKLETDAAMSCAQNMTPELEQQLRAALSEIEAASITKQPGTLFKASTRFYGVIFQGAGHTIAWEVVQRLNGRISRLRIMTLTSTDREVTGPEHMRMICDAIIARDPDAALRAVERHLADAKAIAKKLLDQEAVTA